MVSALVQPLSAGGTVEVSTAAALIIITNAAWLDAARRQ